MANKTLSLPKPKDPLSVLEADTQPDTAPPAVSDDAIAAYLRSKGFTVEQRSNERSDILPDRTEHLPTAPSRPFDLSTIPPPGERGSAPVQAPAKTWGNPRLLRSAPPGPQPLFVPPKGR